MEGKKRKQHGQVTKAFLTFPITQHTDTQTHTQTHRHTDTNTHTHRERERQAQAQTQTQTQTHTLFAAHGWFEKAHVCCLNVCAFFFGQHSIRLFQGHST